MTKDEILVQLGSKIQQSQNELSFFSDISDILNGVYSDKVVADLQAQISALTAKIDSISAAVAAPIVKTDIAPSPSPAEII